MFIFRIGIYEFYGLVKRTEVLFTSVDNLLNGKDVNFNKNRLGIYQSNVDYCIPFKDLLF